MAKKYSKAAQDKIEDVMHEWKKGKLKSSSGEKVTDQKQAVAIAISEAKQDGLKVPQQKISTAKKKTAPKKSAKKK